MLGKALVLLIIRCTSKCRVGWRLVVLGTKRALNGARIALQQKLNGHSRPFHKAIKKFLCYTLAIQIALDGRSTSAHHVTRVAGCYGSPTVCRERRRFFVSILERGLRVAWAFPVGWRASVETGLKLPPERLRPVLPHILGRR